MRSAILPLLGLVSQAMATYPPYAPTRSEMLERYRSLKDWQTIRAAMPRTQIADVKWAGDQAVCVLSGGLWSVVDCKNGKKEPLFDINRLAQAIGKFQQSDVDPASLSFQLESISDDAKSATIRRGKDILVVDRATYVVAKAPTKAQGAPAARNARLTEQGELQVQKNGEWKPVGDGQYRGLHFSEGGAKALTFRLIPGDRREVFLIKSSPAGGGRATLEKRLYDQPGDKLDTYAPEILDVLTGAVTKVAIEPIMGGGQPWSAPPEPRLWSDGREMIFDFPLRGYQEHRVVSINLETGSVRPIITEQSDTFVDQINIQWRVLADQKSLIWRSERTGWANYYQVDSLGRVKPITSGDFVVRNILKVDEKNRRLFFEANGREAGNPYQIHAYSIDFDGTRLAHLTPSEGTHAVRLSPGGKFLVDTVQSVDQAPQSFLRRASDGRVILQLTTANDEPIKKSGVRLPEPFRAKGRDGKTDLYGVVLRPRKMEPGRSYPVIENIYAGPHDAFVPQNFTPTSSMAQLADLGFIVVQIDGMGTNHRGKQFHNVCYKNIVDAGFPDRIAWIKALASKYPEVDASRVGIYGTSAGGQNAAGAVLTHPEFYKSAVASCGCHDNRMDKQWWNEQWMGYPVGKHYEEQSNITLAKNLQGNLLLLLGEQDRNVPPESTLRLVDALIKAGKEFEFMILPGLDHTDGGSYGERKRRDFFVRTLHGIVPPDWNAQELK